MPEQIFLSSFFTAFVTLFIIIDPILVAPLFAALTHQNTQKERRSIAIQAAFISLGVLVFFALLGPTMLHHLGIELSSFRAAGGLLLFLIGFRMFFNPDEEMDAKRPGPKASSRDNVAFFPLALPMLAGPGGIATVMLLMGDGTAAYEEQALWAKVGVIAALTLVLLIAIPVMMSSGAIARALGRTGMNMISRLLGMLLMALATQYVFDGVRVGIFERVGHG
ncbi:MAG: MarC family protein [Parvularculaceae bacterium]|nr:MarC family protein [Parvularculaceae bacterium]